MTTVMYLLPLLGWAQVDLPTWIARIFTTNPVSIAATGVALHLFMGTTYAWLFASQIEPRLALRPAAAGLLFGVALWMFAQTIGVPLVGAIAASLHDIGTPAPSWFAMRLGFGSALSSLVAHIAYGTSLAVVYGREGVVSADGRPTRVWAAAPVQTSSVR
jgi:uncharacterized membrane protein YagU involved in acid resistance